MVKKTNIKETKGITLIALVITIIVLLILAGVAISMLSGENGILTRASEAKEQTEAAQNEESVALISMEIETDFIANSIPYKCSNGYITGFEYSGSHTVNNVKEVEDKLPEGYKIVSKYNNTEKKYEPIEENEKNSTYISTGMVLQKDGKEVARIVLFGDVNGDGEISNLDANNITNFVLGDDSIEQNRYVIKPICYTRKDLENKYRQEFNEKLKSSSYKIEYVEYNGNEEPRLTGVSNQTKVGDILNAFGDDNIRITDTDGETCERDDIVGNEYTVIYTYKDGREIDVCYIINI